MIIYEKTYKSQRSRKLLQTIQTEEATLIALSRTCLAKEVL
jgi:hypothetical protein